MPIKTAWTPQLLPLNATTWTKGRLLGFDLETTGVDPCSDVPVSAALIDFDGGELRGIEHFLINPGRPIPDGAAAIHGITTERAIEEGVELQAGMERIMQLLSSAAEADVPVVGMNLVYDLTMVECVQRSLGGKPASELGLSVIDVLCIDRHFDRYRKGKRTLGALCEHYGAELSNAHDAAGDASASIAVLLALAYHYPEIADSHPCVLHAHQIEWHRQWAAEYSSWHESQGRSPLPDREMQWPFAAP